jgi:hypothetical protein
VVVIFILGTTAEVAVLGYISLAADDGLYACFLGCQVELNSTIHYSVVGYRQAIHSHLSGSFNQLRDAAHAVKQTIFSMDMKVSEHGFD